MLHPVGTVSNVMHLALSQALKRDSEVLRTMMLDLVEANQLLLAEHQPQRSRGC